MKWFISLLLPLAPATLAIPFHPNHTDSSWPGWKNIKHMFVFGDSYTQTGFNVNGTQPNPSNPMGNPPFPGWTASNGPNWVDFLTYTYNASYLQTYNLAYGGATVDSALVAPYMPTVVSLKSQVLDLFLPTYAHTAWTSQTALFAFWIGINDVGNSWWLNNATLYDAIFAEYDSLLEELYEVGARNFLFLAVPPVNRAPLTLQNGEEAVEGEGRVIVDWNDRLVVMSHAFQDRHDEKPSVFVHDTWQTFTSALDDPSVFPQTNGIRNTTGWCKVYENGTPDWYTYDEQCGIPVNEYFWLNNLHPTFPIHNATAASIVDYLDTMTLKS